MTYPYRCCSCRARNTSKVKVNNWLPVRGQKLTARELTKRLKEEGGARCWSCGHTSFYLDKYRMQRRPCVCDGSYHWGPHRPGSPYCIHNPHVHMNRARREGATDEQLDDLSLDLAWSGEGGKHYHPGAECPF